VLPTILRVLIALIILGEEWELHYRHLVLGPEIICCGSEEYETFYRVEKTTLRVENVPWVSVE
jgi:hypothetical protein